MDPSDKCHICLSDFGQQTVGSLHNCRHVFCLDCILRWSRTANTCPVDRIPFTVIHQRRCPGGDIQKEVKVRRTQKTETDDHGDDEEEEEEEEEASDAVVCEECGRSDRRRRLLVCTGCDSGCHTDCLSPSLNTAPGGDWICPECALSPHLTDGSAVEEQISDEELTDLLADADQTASTSGRLRPSTANRRSGSVERRRSARVRSRTGDQPGPRPRTPRHVPKHLLRASRPAAAPGEFAELFAGGSSVELNTRKRKTV